MYRRRPRPTRGTSEEEAEVAAGVDPSTDDPKRATLEGPTFACGPSSLTSGADIRPSRLNGTGQRYRLVALCASVP